MKALHKGLLASLIAASGFIAAGAHAADTTITINGKVMAAACTVDMADQTVTMPDVTANLLETAGAVSAAGKKDFDVTLSACPYGTSTVTATFTGNPATGQTTKYANTAGAGYATNVAVQLQNRGGTVADKGNGSTMTVNVDAAKKATFALTAAPYSLGNATVGDIKTVVLMDFEYN